eukprot:5966120-Pyramimonas_sp.AAC.1
MSDKTSFRVKLAAISLSLSKALCSDESVGATVSNQAAWEPAPQAFGGNQNALANVGYDGESGGC